MKKCSKCKTVKLLNEFNNVKTGKFGVHHYCKLCLGKLKKEKYNYEKSKLYSIMHKYNLSKERLNQIYTIQEGKCKICGNKHELISKHNGLYIDHCHKTGKVRGLLCKSCNSLLGYAYDNIEILKNAIIYLQ